jgi:RHS repeat-associated protein
LTERRIWNAIYGSGITNKWVYTYDLNGNMTEVSKQNGASVQTEKWLYTWNPRDQLTKVEKRTGTGAGTYAGQVEYAYCLSCDGALAYRKEYDQTSETSIRRYEYDGLKLLRVDEVYDSDSDNDLDDDYAANGGLGNWRTVEASTYGPGIVGNLLGKVVYTHTDDDATPDSQADYYYHYDHVGNVYLVTDDEGEEVYRFSQDAFGNELDFGNYTGDSWATAAAAGIGEHQTGKWIDEFSGLYFFSARWYDSGVGRFIARDKINNSLFPNRYQFNLALPTMRVDPNGLASLPLIDFDIYKWGDCMRSKGWSDWCWAEGGGAALGYASGAFWTGVIGALGVAALQDIVECMWEASTAEPGGGGGGVPGPRCPPGEPCPEPVPTPTVSPASTPGCDGCGGNGTSPAPTPPDPGPSFIFR